MTDQWVSEKWEHVETRYRIKSFLYEEKSEFQHMQLVDTHEYGKMLLLDGIVQTTEKDEFIYHEMMAHIPVISHPEPKDILIIGGGDGGVLREVLKHPGVKRADMVEIDPDVVTFSKMHLPSISDGAFENVKTNLIFDDGAEFVKKTDRRYDVVIVDSPDPIGPAKVLFGQMFYENIHNILKPGGIMVRQTGSTHMQVEEQKTAYDLLKNIYRCVSFYVFVVPTYVGGFFSSVFGSDSINPREFDKETMQKKVDEAGLETKYYNPGIHMGAFMLPSFLEGNIK